MDFERYFSQYERCLKLGLSPTQQSWKEFYNELIMSFSTEETRRIFAGFNLNSSVNQVLAEKHWYLDGKPYFKVWPSMIDEFTTTRLDIPCEILKQPYTAFCIYLPKEPILDFHDKGQHWQVKSMLVYFSEASIVASGELEDSLEATVWIDIGEEDNGVPVLTYRHAIFSGSGTIEEAFAKLPPDPVEFGVAMPREITEACVRLAIATCFLASGGSRVLERDILSRHLDAYLKEPQQSPLRAKWEAKSLKYGLGGWHVGRGRQERELHLGGKSYHDALRESGGRSLFYQHKRRGHFRVVRFGPQKQQARVDWQDELVIRKDLPPKPLDR